MAHLADVLIRTYFTFAHLQNLRQHLQFTRINIMLQVALRIGMPAFMLCFALVYFGYVIFYIYPYN